MTQFLRPEGCVALPMEAENRRPGTFCLRVRIYRGPGARRVKTQKAGYFSTVVTRSIRRFCIR